MCPLPHRKCRPGRIRFRKTTFRRSLFCYPRASAYVLSKSNFSREPVVRVFGGSSRFHLSPFPACECLRRSRFLFGSFLLGRFSPLGSGLQLKPQGVLFKNPSRLLPFLFPRKSLILLVNFCPSFAHPGNGIKGFLHWTTPPSAYESQPIRSRFLLPNFIFQLYQIRLAT